MTHRSEFFLLASALAAALVVGACSKQPTPIAAVPTVTAPAANVSDVDVTEHVKTALRQNETLKGFDISVETLKGDVRLSGMLDSRAQVDEAIRIARAAEGAHAIHDELTVKAP